MTPETTRHKPLLRTRPALAGKIRLVCGPKEALDFVQDHIRDLIEHQSPPRRVEILDFDGFLHGDSLSPTFLPLEDSETLSPVKVLRLSSGEVIRFFDFLTSEDNSNEERFQGFFGEKNEIIVLHEGRPQGVARNVRWEWVGNQRECIIPRLKRCFLLRGLAFRDLEDLEKMFEVCGLDYSMIRNIAEIASLAYKEEIEQRGKKAMTFDDLAPFLPTERTPRIFRFLDLLMARNPLSLLEFLRFPLGTLGEVVGMVAWQITLILQVKQLKDEGVLSPVQALVDMSMGIAKSYPAKKAGEAARRFSWEELEQVVKSLLLLEFDTKSGRCPDPWFRLLLIFFSLLHNDK